MNVFTLILAGGDSPELSTLGEPRPTAALPFGGKYRIIDFALSNCANSGLSDVAVVTQYRPHSLHDHVSSGRPWDLDRTQGGIRIWQPYRGRSGQGWQRGTADALYQNRDFILEEGCDTLLVLPGDHIYKQDYRALLQAHQEKGADVTIAVRDVPRAEIHRFGIVETDDQQRITALYEKQSTFHGTLASMGVYVFNTDYLLKVLEEDAGDSSSQHDFGRNIIPAMIADRGIFAFHFDGYWVDIGTIPAYWQAHVDLLAGEPALDLYDQSWIIHTRSQERPPVKILASSHVERSLLSNGCVVAGTVVNAVLSPGVIVEAGAEVRDAIIMTDTVIRAGARVDHCIVDKEVVVEQDAQLGVGDDQTPNRDEPEYLFNGLTIVGKAARIPAQTRVGRNCRIGAGAQASDFPGLEIPSGESVDPQAADVLV